MNKKHIFLLILFLISTLSFSQNKYITKTGNVDFEASVSSFEEVKAINNSTTAIVNVDNGDFAALILVKGFRFKNALMEEHFNENYAESDTYPKATFKGKIKDLNVSTLNTTSIFKADGTLTFHGKSKSLNDIAFKINNVDGLITITGTFDIKVSDFDIDIPKIVSDKVAETVNVSFDFTLNKK
ncbi:YceI family protein [uncultured Algibacter sp.]|uniref:YceI family protein n=1 Tax=uncultured Algibacter sp. TaxID=298659 RepID=UPI003216FC65